MKVRDKLMLGILGCILVFGMVVAVAAMASNADTDRLIGEVDAFLEEYENRPEPSFEFEHHMMRMAADARTAQQYTWNQEMIGKVVAFEVGNCCKQCQYYVASACVNRFYDWYNCDVIAMITDNNGYYYQMNPEYVWMDECNTVNFWEVYDEIMPTIDRATNVPLQVYYWDCADTQSEWATLVWHCMKDNCWFYR